MSDKHELDDGLTDEERLALSEEEEGTHEPEAKEDGEPIGDPEPEEEPANKPEPAAAAAAAAEPARAEEDQPQSAPLLVAPSVEDADARLIEIASQKEELGNQFDDGDITAREYQKKLDELSKQERQIEFDVREAQLAAKLEQQRLQNDWISTCNAFVEANSIYKDNPRLYKALDQEVRDLAQKPETANWSGAKFLAEAHRNLAEAFNLPTANAATKPRAPKATDNLPPNLAKVPAADVQDTDGGRFAVLDRLAATDPIAYEDALAKMPQAERDAYMAVG